jgi:AbrB family looped-hinge helix DNA binding protein
MKATGIVRRIDELGRVVIPKEIRATLRLKSGDPILTTLRALNSENNDNLPQQPQKSVEQATQQSATPPYHQTNFLPYQQNGTDIYIQAMLSLKERLYIV